MLFLNHIETYYSMKHILHSLLLFVIALAFSQESFAQLSSQNALGGRFGSASGITYRYSLSNDRAIEGILNVQSSSSYSRFRLVGLYEYHKILKNDLTWYYGFGGSIGSYTYKAYTDGSGKRYNSESQLALSIDGILGIEYAIPSAPISISLDIKPYFDFIQDTGIKFFNPALSIRYKF